MAGGAPLPIEVKRGFEAIRAALLVEGYGLSETSPVAACNPPDAPREGSIGLPLPATEISIRSLDDPTVEVKTGETGEICIAGPQVMTGYWNKPQDTEDCFAGRFFRTGDVGYMDPDGYIFIVDRIKDVRIVERAYGDLGGREGKPNDPSRSISGRLQHATGDVSLSP